MTAEVRPPRWLVALPELAALYLRWSNRNERGRLARLSGLVLATVTVLIGWLFWTHLAIVASELKELRHHGILIGALAGIVSATVVYRRRGAHATRVEKSWLAALPRSTRARRIEALALILAPLIVAWSMVFGFGALLLAFLALAHLPLSGFVALLWLIAGSLCGVLTGMIIPAPKPVIPYPGSRYVPHRAARARRPVPSLAALGIWPIRRMFAMLQPKTLARTVFPLLLAIPMGTAAADAMVLIGILGAMTSLAFLATSVVWVLRQSRLWVAPLPLFGTRLVHAVAARALLAMIVIGAVALWLVRVGRP